MRKIFGIATVMLFFSLAMYAQVDSGKTYSLKECVETGIANNLDVLLSDLQAQTSKINWQQARLNRLPTLNGSVGHGINQGRSIDPFTNTYINERVNFASYNLNSGVVLFRGFSMQNTVNQNTLLYEAGKMDLQQAKDNLTLNIILAYLDMLTTEELLVQLQYRVELTQQQVQRLTILNNDGAIAPALLYDMRGQLANDQLAIINAKNTLETNKISLCTLMNIPYDKGMKLERLDPSAFSLDYTETPSQIYEKALSGFALIRSAGLKTRAAAKGIKATRGQLFPTLSLNGSANSNYSSAAMQNIFLNTTEVTSPDYVLVNGSPIAVIRQQSNFRSDKINYTRQLNNNIFTSISLNLSIPIFNSLQTRNRIKLAKIDLERLSASEHTAKTELQQNIERAYVNMKASFERYKTLLEQVNAYTQSFRAAEIRFNEGVGNSIDYLTAKNNLDMANNNLVVWKYDYILRTRILDYYQGR